MKPAGSQDRGFTQGEINELLELVVSVICATGSPTATRDMVFRRITSEVAEINGLAEASVLAFPNRGRKPPAIP